MLKHHPYIAICVVITILFGVVAHAKNSGLSSSVTENDVNTLVNGINHYANEKDFPHNIHEAYYASSALALLNSKSPKENELCTYSRDVLKNKEIGNRQDVESIYHAIGLLQNIKCSGTLSADKAIVDAIKEVIENGDDLEDLYYAGTSALNLRKLLKDFKDVTEDDITSLVSKITDLGEEDGTFRSTSSDKEGSLYNTGLALQILARISTETKLTEDDKDSINSVVERVESIIGMGDDEEGTLVFTDSSDKENPIVTTSLVLRGLDALAKSQKKKIDVHADDIVKIGEYLLHHKHGGSLKDTYHLVAGLRTVQNNAIGIPLALVLEKGSILSTAKGAEGHVRVRLTDVFDQFATTSKVYLVKASPVGKDTTTLIANQELVAASTDKNNVVYQINFLGAKPDQGFYTLEFRAVPPEKFGTIDSAVRTLKVAGSVSITDLEILVADSKESALGHSEGASKYRAEQGHKIDDIRIDHLQHINIQFRVRSAGGSTRPLVVQQAFVKFTHVESGHEVFFPATPNDNKLYSAFISMEDSAKKIFRSHSGKYTLEILVGDAFIQNPIHWTVSTNLDIHFLSHPTTKSNPHAALPEIKHVFRVPEKRPPGVVSDAFSLLVLSPLLFLLVGFARVGANINRFPFSGTNFIFSVGFVSCIGLICLLMATYWLRLNLVQTLGYLAILSVPTVFFGQRALSYSASTRKAE